jgi:acetolactate synthase-1/2/3 large subunit
MDNTLIADCSALLSALADNVQGREWGNAQWDALVQQAVEQAGQGLRDQCGAYAKLNDAIEKALRMTACWCAISPCPAACGAAACSAPTAR